MISITQNIPATDSIKIGGGYSILFLSLDTAFKIELYGQHNLYLGEINNISGSFTVQRPERISALKISNSAAVIKEFKCILFDKGENIDYSQISGEVSVSNIDSCEVINTVTTTVSNTVPVTFAGTANVSLTGSRAVTVDNDEIITRPDSLVFPNATHNVYYSGIGDGVGLSTYLEWSIFNPAGSGKVIEILSVTMPTYGSLDYYYKNITSVGGGTAITPLNDNRSGGNNSVVLMRQQGLGSIYNRNDASIYVKRGRAGYPHSFTRELGGICLWPSYGFAFSIADNSNLEYKRFTIRWKEVNTW